MITTLAELLAHLAADPPEHYVPRERPWDLDHPVRLVYPDYTPLRKRLNERKRS